MNMDEKQRIELRVSETPEQTPLEPAAESAAETPVPESNADQPSSYREFRKRQKEKARSSGANEGAKRLTRLLAFGAGVTAILIAMLAWWFISQVNRYRAAYVPPPPPAISASSPAMAAQKYESLVSLQPDRSFQAAFREVASFTGQSLPAPELSGNLSYQEKLAALNAYAKQCVEKAAIAKGELVASSAPPSFGIKALLDDLATLDKKMGNGVVSGAIAAQASRDLAELDYVSPNSIGGNEPIVGRALALAAIAAATGQDVAATEVALALDMGYMDDARTMVQKLPACNLWRKQALNQVKNSDDFYHSASIPAGDPAHAFVRLHDRINFWARAALDERALSMLNDVLEKKPLTNGVDDVPSNGKAREIAEQLDSGSYNAAQIARLQKNLAAAAPSGKLLDQKILAAYFNTYFYGLIFDVADQLEYGFGSYDMIHDLHKSLGKQANMQPPAAEMARLLDMRGWARPVTEYESMLREPTNFGNGMRASEFRHLKAIDFTKNHIRYGLSLLLKDLDSSRLGQQAGFVAALNMDPFAAAQMIKNIPVTVKKLPPAEAVRAPHKPVKATPAMLSDAAEKAASWREADLFAYGDLLRDNGKLDEAYKVYERSFGRYNDDRSMSRMMGALWRQGKAQDAAAFFNEHRGQIDTDWTQNYGPEFADAFANNPEGGQKAFDAMIVSTGMYWSYYEGIAKNFAGRGDMQNAFKYQSQLTSGTPMFEARNRLIAYDYLCKLKGEAEATKWLKETIASSPKLADATQFAVPALTTRILEPLWTVLPANPTDPKAALIWEARAAAEAAQPGLADKTGGHLKDLKAWAEKADSPVSKYYLGMTPATDIMNAAAKDATQLRLLCIALGWKAEAGGDVVNAARWYAIAANVGPQNIPDFVDLPVQRLFVLSPQVIAKK